MYPNTEYLESIQMDKTEFERMCKMSSWGISGEREDQKDDTEENAEENEHGESFEEEEDTDQTM